MSIREQDVRHVARLARLKLTDEDLQTHTLQLSRILEYVEQIKQLDMEGVRPTFHVLSELADVTREDKVAPGVRKQDALAQAPSADDGQFKVPAVIVEGDSDE